MSEHVFSAGVSGELCAVNHDLARLLHMGPCSLPLGADRSMGDDLVLYGILGGKDVGKSTLINALAQTPVSTDSEEVGRGTHRPMIYVHRSAEAVARSRMQDVEQMASLDLCVHDADLICNVVLIDMPDFDSEYGEHLRIVQSVAPFLDRVVWIQTPRKIADRLWVELFRDVFKDDNNVYFVLNKVDELLSDSEPFAAGAAADKASGDGSACSFWRNQSEWFASALERAGAGSSPQHRFMISAAFPSAGEFVARIAQRWDDPDWMQFAADRKAVEQCAQLVEGDICRLRQTVLSEVSSDQVNALKASNQTREHQAFVARIKNHFAIDRLTADLERACDPKYLRYVLGEYLGAEYSAAAASALVAQLNSPRRLADELLERRVEAWPLLRLVYWPFGWLSRMASPFLAASRMASSTRDSLFGTNGEAVANSLADTKGLKASASRPLDVGGRPFAGQIDLIRTRILADHASVAGQLSIDSKMPAVADLASDSAARAAALPASLDRQVLDDIQAADGKPSWWGRAALWLILLWFPLLQPMLQGLLEVCVETGTWHTIHGAYRIVSALSAPKLLAGLLVVIVIFVALLAGMYAWALRAIQSARTAAECYERCCEAIDNLIVDEVAVPLLQPFQAALDRITTIGQRLDQCAGQDERKAR